MVSEHCLYTKRCLKHPDKMVVPLELPMKHDFGTAPKLSETLCYLQHCQNRMGCGGWAPLFSSAGTGTGYIGTRPTRADAYLTVAAAPYYA